jgi:hypothetical protein
MPKEAYTLAELVEMHSSGLASTIKQNGVAVIVCALTESQFETQVTFNPKFAKDAKKSAEITDNIGKAAHALLMEGLDLAPPKIILA